MSAFQPPPACRHEHIISERPLFRGAPWTKPYCFRCGLTLAACLTESGATITRPGFELIVFTSWSRIPTMGES